MTSHSHRPATLIATLGSEPQVVTAGLDLLLKQGVNVHSVEIVHTSATPDSPIHEAVLKLTQACQDYSAPLCEAFHFHPLLVNGIPVADVESASASQAVFRLLYTCVWNAKQRGDIVHLLIAGGRKTMSIYGMVVGQMLFDESDHLWHLFSAGDFLTSKRMHPQPGDQVELSEIPVIRWSEISPIIGVLRSSEDAMSALETIRSFQIERRNKEVERFIQKHLTPAERRVVACLLEEGEGDEEIAQRLHLSPRTVEQHLRSVYAKAQDFWGIERVTRSGLIILLSPHQWAKIRENPHDKS